MDSTRRRTVPGNCSPQRGTWHKLCLAIFFLSLLHYSQAQKTPLQEKGIEIKHQMGTNAIMTCIVADLGTRQIIWSKLSDPYPISVGRTLFNPSKKYAVDVTANQSVLTVKKVRLDDAGEYQCRVSGQVYLAETLTLNIQTEEGSTHLLPSDTEVRSQVGGTAVLPCKVENIQNNQVMWKNSQNDVLTLRKKILNGDSRLSVQHAIRTEWSLQIKNLRPSDFGLYTCIINSRPVLTRTVNLKNLAPAQFSPLLLQDTTFRKRLEVRSGETVTLNCNFRSNPPAKITWYRRKSVDGKSVKEVLGQGNTFILRSVSPEQSGQYICSGDNGVKPPGRGKTQLTVLAPPTAAPVIAQTTFMATRPIAPVMYVDQLRVEQSVGRDALIKCMTIGNPKPEIHWRRSKKRLENDWKYKITEDTIRNDTTVSVLTIKHVVKEDFGEYVCQGLNTLGSKLTPIELYGSS